MSTPRIFVIFTVLTISHARVAPADWPLDPTTPAQTVRLGSRELVWTNTYAIVRDRISKKVEVIAEDSSSFHVPCGGTTTGSRTDYVMESIVGPFVSFTLGHDSSRGRGSSRRWVKHVGFEYPDAGDIRKLFDEIDIVSVLERKSGGECSVGEFRPGALFQILRTCEALPCALRRGLVDQWAVSEIGEDTAIVSVVGEQCPPGENQTVIELPIPETKRLYFDEARRLGTTRSDLIADPLHSASRPSLHLRDLPRPWTVPWVPPETQFREATVGWAGEKTRFRWNNDRCQMSDADQPESGWRTVFGREYSVTDFGWSRDSFETVDRELVAIVGPFVTYREVRRSSDRRGSRVTVQFKTENSKQLLSGPVTINTLFDEDELVRSLIQSAVFAPHVGDFAAASLQELNVRGDPCGVFHNLTTSWAILDFDDGRARVRFTLPAAEEICGDYHETFDIVVPVKSEWIEPAKAAADDGLLGVHSRSAAVSLVQPWEAQAR